MNVLGESIAQLQRSRNESNTVLCELAKWEANMATLGTTFNLYI